MTSLVTGHVSVVCTVASETLIGGHTGSLADRDFVSEIVSGAVTETVIASFVNESDRAPSLAYRRVCVCVSVCVCVCVPEEVN